MRWSSHFRLRVSWQLWVQTCCARDCPASSPEASSQLWVLRCRARGGLANFACGTLATPGSEMLHVILSSQFRVGHLKNLLGLTWGRLASSMALRGCLEGLLEPSWATLRALRAVPMLSDMVPDSHQVHQDALSPVPVFNTCPPTLDLHWKNTLDPASPLRFRK